MQEPTICTLCAREFLASGDVVTTTSRDHSTAPNRRERAAALTTDCSQFNWTAGRPASKALQ
jgi:hypothetical protein